MRFVFSHRFYILLAAGLIPLSLSWRMPWLRSAVLAYDILLVAAALFDYFVSRRLPEGFHIRREFEKGFSAWHQKKYGSPAKIRWPDIGGSCHFRRQARYHFTVPWRRVAGDHPGAVGLRPRG